MFSSSVIAEEKRLTIYLFESSSTSWEPLETPIFLEGKSYDIAVTEGDEPQFAYNVTVAISAFEETYVTSEELLWITITAPQFEDHEQFVITATKEGYAPAEKLVAIIKGELLVTTDRHTVREEESFSVVVKDHEDNGVSGALVYMNIDGDSSDSDLTNANGIAYLSAPQIEADEESITIVALKVGYKDGSTTIRVENVYLMTLLSDIAPFFPIIAAIIVVLLAILIVSLRKKSSRFPSKPGIGLPSEKERINVEKEQPVTGIPKPKEIVVRGAENVEKEMRPLRGEPKVEEIRIHRSENKKTTTHITDGEEPQKVIPRKSKKDEQEWFEGTDDVRYKIDQLTGEIDEETRDKWFEGTSDIRSKIDEAISKKHKKEKNS